MTTLHTWMLYALAGGALAVWCVCMWLITANIGLRFRVAALVKALARRDEADCLDRRSTEEERRWRAERWPTIYRPRGGESA